MANRPMSPAEPIKKLPPPIQPNAHPYAIKTTSTALLSRSNSSPHSAHHTRHHYIPSPSGIPTGRVRHGHSSSLPSIEGEIQHGVNGVCTPQSTVATSPDNLSASLKHTDLEPKLAHRVRRAETMSSSATESSYDLCSHDQESRPGLYAGLPPNPKQWNTDELTTYLETSFQLGNNAPGDKDDSNLVDILQCVRARGLTGRELLRLTEADLARTSLSGAQCAQLLEHSRTIRAHVLRGRIYADSYSHEISDNSHALSQSPCPSAPYNSIRAASVSADDLHSLLDSEGSDGPPSPVLSLHRSNSVSDASAQRYRDLARMRMRRRGKVKCLVETWERTSTSGSECSASDVESESETNSELDHEPVSDLDINHSPVSPPILPSGSHDEICSPMDSLVDVPQESLLSTSPPPYTHADSTAEAIKDDEEEPSIEELLASSSNIPLKGARAWEADFAMGDTVKRISAPGSVDARSPLHFVTEQGVLHLKDDGQQASVRSKRSGSTRSRVKNAEMQRRVVTAIFTGPLSEDVSKDSSDEVQFGHYRHTSPLRGIVRREPLVNSRDPDGALQALEDSIAASRVQLEAFRLRLEHVEADTARHEAMLMQAQFSDSISVERRSETNEKVMSETIELHGDDTLIEGRRQRDVLEVWETMSLTDIARVIIMKAVGWLFPQGYFGVQIPEDRDKFRARSDSQCRIGVDDRCRSPVKRGGPFLVARMSCSVILVSFAICAAVLRRIGFGRWFRRP